MGSFSLKAAASKPMLNQSCRCWEPKVRLRKMKCRMNRTGLWSFTDKFILSPVLSLGGCVPKSHLKRISLEFQCWQLLWNLKPQQPDTPQGIGIGMSRLYPVLHYRVIYLRPTLNEQWFSAPHNVQNGDTYYSPILCGPLQLRGKKLSAAATKISAAWNLKQWFPHKHTWHLQTRSFPPPLFLVYTIYILSLRWEINNYHQLQ